MGLIMWRNRLCLAMFFWILATFLLADFSIKEKGVVLSKDHRFIYIDFTTNNGVVRDMFFDVYREGFLDSGEHSMRFIARIWTVSAQTDLSLTQTSSVEEWEKVQVGDIVVVPAATLDYLVDKYMYQTDSYSAFPQEPQAIVRDSVPPMKMEVEPAITYEEQTFSSSIIDRIGKKIFIKPFDDLQTKEILYISNVPNMAIHPQTGELVAIERQLRLPFMVLQVYKDFLELELIKPQFYHSLNYFSAGRAIEVVRKVPVNAQKQGTNEKNMAVGY